MITVFLSALRPHRIDAQIQLGASDKIVETTVTALIMNSAKFHGKHVKVSASFHTDGIERSVLMEPNCRVPGTHDANRPQCRRGIVPMDSDKAEDDPGDQSLDRVLAERNGAMDKHITAAFTGIFRCVPSCASPKWFTLKIERVENLKVERKDTNPQPTKEADHLTACIASSA